MRQTVKRIALAKTVRRLISLSAAMRQTVKRIALAKIVRRLISLSVAMRQTVYKPFNCYVHIRFFAITPTTAKKRSLSGAEVRVSTPLNDHFAQRPRMKRSLSRAEERFNYPLSIIHSQLSILNYPFSIINSQLYFIS